jgi:hypothetical protein
MQTASDASACSGVISRPDPTFPVEPEDVIQEEPLDPAFIESLEAPRSATLSDGMLNLMVPGPDLVTGDELGLLEICRPRRRRKVVLAVAMGLVTLGGILLALGAQDRLSGPRPAQDIPDTSLKDVRLRVKKTARTLARRSAGAKVGRRHARSQRGLTRARRVKGHLRRGTRAYRRGRFAAARREARRALKLDKRNKQARGLERRARAKLEQRRRAIKRQLTRAKRALKQRKWQLARRQARAVLRKDPGNRQARQIKRLAEARLRTKTRRRRG